MTDISKKTQCCQFLNFLIILQPFGKKGSLEHFQNISKVFLNFRILIFIYAKMAFSYFSEFFYTNSEKLQIALAARERAEKKQQEYEDRLKQMQEDMERSQRDLMEAQEMIRRLEEQLKQLQAAKDELELHQKELQSMLQRLEEAKNMEAAEKAKLEEEIMSKQMEVQRIQDEVNAKDEETKRLQDEVEEARRKQVSWLISLPIFINRISLKKKKIGPSMRKNRDEKKPIAL